LKREEEKIKDDKLIWEQKGRQSYLGRERMTNISGYGYGYGKKELWEKVRKLICKNENWRLEKEKDIRVAPSKSARDYEPIGH